MLTTMACCRKQSCWEGNMWLLKWAFYTSIVVIGQVEGRGTKAKEAFKGLAEVRHKGIPSRFTECYSKHWDIIIKCRHVSTSPYLSSSFILVRPNVLTCIKPAWYKWCSINIILFNNYFINPRYAKKSTFQWQDNFLETQDILPLCWIDTFPETWIGLERNCCFIPQVAPSLCSAVQLL